MANLDSSWNLEHRLKTIDCADNLKAEILKYIERENPQCTGKARSFSNIYYRQNLHYIEDNIDSDELLNQLKSINSK